MTIAYRDSSFDRPNAIQAGAAFAAGVRVWGGYLAAVVPPGPRSSGGSNLATSWTQADFQVLQAAGIACVAFASGWDDAGACGVLARAWGVRLVLDVEDGIRGDGPWVDDWLTASGAGIYGLCGVHDHPAPAHIVARYPGVPVAASSWDPLCAAPAGLLGWQAEGTHTDPATGLQVDGGWVDEGFAAALPVPGPGPGPADRWGSSEEGTLIDFEYNGQLHTAETDAGGTVQHRFFFDAAWHRDQPLTGLVSNSPLAFNIGFNGQLHLFGRRPDGTQGHAYFDGTWHPEVIP